MLVESWSGNLIFRLCLSVKIRAVPFLASSYFSMIRCFVSGCQGSPVIGRLDGMCGSRRHFCISLELFRGWVVLMFPVPFSWVVSVCFPFLSFLASFP